MPAHKAVRSGDQYDGSAVLHDCSGSLRLAESPWIKLAYPVIARSSENVVAAATARSAIEESDDNDAASMASANSPGIEGVTTQPRLFSMTVNAASASSSETRMTGRPMARRL